MHLTPHQAKYIAHDLTLQHGGLDRLSQTLFNASVDLNPLLADLFRRIDMVEAWGRGMPLILQNAPDVEFREIARLFVGSFERPSAAAVTTQETEAIGPKTGLEPPRKPQENPVGAAAATTRLQHLRHG